MPNFRELNENRVRKIIPIIFVIETSENMRGVRISALNQAMEKIGEYFRDISTKFDGWWRVGVMRIGVLQYASGANWVTSQNELLQLDDFYWYDLAAGGAVDLGSALDELNNKLSMEALLNSAIRYSRPLIIFVGSSEPTDDYEAALNKINKNIWYNIAGKIALTVDDGAPSDVFTKITGARKNVITCSDMNSFEELLRRWDPFRTVDSYEIAYDEMEINQSNDVSWRKDVTNDEVRCNHSNVVHIGNGDRDDKGGDDDKNWLGVDGWNTPVAKDTSNDVSIVGSHNTYSDSVFKIGTATSNLTQRFEMECPKCKKCIDVEANCSAVFSFCPFCGGRFHDVEIQDVELKPSFDTSRDTLIYIAKTHGNEVLLGKILRNYFSDYGSQVSTNIKDLVKSVFDKGATEILRNNLNAKQEDKVAASKQAIRKLTDAFIEKQAAENVIREFIEALGWKLDGALFSSAPTESSSQPVHIKQNTIRTSQNKGATRFAKPVAPGDTYSFGDINWRVLDVQGNGALLLTEDIAEKRSYHSAWTDTTWADCELREYLNGIGAFKGKGFIDKFDPQDRSRILTVNNINPGNQWFETDGGSNTTDQVFLLSIDETVKNFGDSGQLKNKNPESEYYIEDQYNNARIAKYKEYRDKLGEAWWWWLRSPGIDRDFASIVDNDGALRVRGDGVRSGGGGVRPALWLNLKS